MVQVSPSLIKRRKTHFHHLPCGATIILGNNGYVWICPTETEEMDQTGGYELNWKVTNVETSSMYLSGFYFSLQIYFLSLIKSLVYHSSISLPFNKKLTFNVIGVVCLAKLHKLLKLLRYIIYNIFISPFFPENIIQFAKTFDTCIICIHLS